VWYVLFFILIDPTQSAIELYAVDVNNTEELLSATEQKWPTSFWTQYRMLTWRTFKQSRGHVMNKYDLVQCIFMAILAGIVFFQIDLSFRTLRDEMGVVSWLNLINLQLQWEWSAIYTCPIYNYNRSGQLLSLAQFKSTMSLGILGKV